MAKFMKNYDSIIASLKGYLKMVFNKVEKFGIWLLLIFIVYIILIIKVINAPHILNSIFLGGYSFLITAYIFSRFIFSYFHRSVKANLKYQPSVTFVVPAKNEGDNIAKTIRGFSQVNYPKEKIEVIVINDGSIDNTLNEMLKVKEEFDKKNIRIQVVDFKINRGKRAAMAEGVHKAKNEIIIFIDSDSFIDRDCVIHLVKYFSNPQVGAVSGHTDVHNQEINLLTRMQAVRYYIAFSVYKAAESLFGTVTCCPGCCSAYRKEYLLEFLDKWENQRFLGSNCTFGDDRSLTNFVIRKYDATYSPEAKASTIVPANFRQYLRQQQRWKKSWVRETLIASQFMWKKNAVAAVSFYAYVILALASPIIFFRAIFWQPIMTYQLPIPYLAGLFLMLFLHGLYYRTKVGKKPWFFAIIFFWFVTVILMWQLPWAAATMKDTRWGTR